MLSPALATKINRGTMANTYEEKLDKVEEHVDKLKKLLKDRHPGLSSYCDAVFNELDQLARLRL